MDTAFDVEGLKEGADRLAVSIRVFIAGPAIDMATPPKDKVKNAAAYLRYFLFSELKKVLRDPPVLGEHRELQKIYKDTLKGDYDLASNEFIHVQKYSDVIIIIPSSPGSFAELGMFCIKESNCRKMMVLLDETKSAKPGYVHLGPSALAESYGAQVLDVDYEDVVGILELVKEFIEKIRNKKYKKENGIGI